MEQQKLPNATTSIVLSIFGYLCCCFSAGIGGIILSAIALVLANKDKKAYALAPEQYSNYSQVNTARILAIVGLVLGVLVLGMGIFQIISAGGWEGYMEQQREVYEQLGIELD